MKKEIQREIKEYVHRENAIAKAKKSGMLFPRKPNVPSEFLDEYGNLVIPNDITEMPTEELGRYLTLFTTLTAYYDVVVACADIDLITASRVNDYLEAKTLLETTGSTLTERKAIRDCNSMVISAQNWLDELKAFYKLTEAILKGSERLVFLLSREITRRMGSDSRSYRDYNINVRGGDNERPTIYNNNV